MCRIAVFTYLGERLTRKLRQQTFEAITRQAAIFFDKVPIAIVLNLYSIVLRVVPLR